MFGRISLPFAAVITMLLALLGSVAWADDAARAAEGQAAFEAARKVAKHGPAEVAFTDQAVMKLPDGYVFVPRPEADKLMQVMGNHVDDRFIGLVFPAGEENWFIAAEFEKSGYIRDDDAKNWNVDELFDSLKQGTEAANEERRKQGFRELEVVGWVERPRYDAATHRLVWSMSARGKGAAAGEGQTINYNSYALGREGYLTLNLITDLDKIDGFKSHAHTLLAALEYKSGKAYADFDEKTDKVAAYGLAALIGGVAAKKLGLFAVIAAFVAKFAKVIGLAVIGGLAVLGKFFKRKKDTDNTA